MVFSTSYLFTCIITTTTPHSHSTHCIAHPKITPFCIEQLAFFCFVFSHVEALVSNHVPFLSLSLVHFLSSSASLFLYLYYPAFFPTAHRDFRCRSLLHLGILTSIMSATPWFLEGLIYYYVPFENIFPVLSNHYLLSPGYFYALARPLSSITQGGFNVLCNDYRGMLYRLEPKNQRKENKKNLRCQPAERTIF
jgi:hypothetical protein